MASLILKAILPLRVTYAVVLSPPVSMMVSMSALGDPSGTAATVLMGSGLFYSGGGLDVFHAEQGIR